MVTLPAPLSTAKSNVIAPLISTGTTNSPESSFNGTSTTEDDFLFTAGDGGVVMATFGGPTSDAAASIAGAGSMFSTVPFVQWVAASSAACFNSAGSRRQRTRLPIGQRALSKTYCP